MADPAVIPGRLDEWVARQRWFPGLAADATETAATLPLSEDGTVRTLLLRDATPGAEAVYQVPVVAADDGGLLDGPRTRAYVEALLRLLFDGGTARGDEATAHGVRIGWEGPAPALVDARVLSGEQSNTSIIVDARRADGTAVGLMVKVFRALHDGENPDVVLQSAISEAGSRRVPETYGAVVGSWPDARVEGGVAHGHLAVAQEFLADTRDAWRVALDAARAGEDFTAPARDLGAATAEVHAVLAQALPTADADETSRAALLRSMRARAASAAALVPSVAAVEGPVAAVLAAGADGPWPALQRIHGDYHLGQVLQVPGRGWVLLDFEGEPLRPMAERNEPDLALRDVAGMLRSFDYVAGTIAQEGGDAEAARAWSDAARSAFLAGYEAGIGTSLAPWSTLLAALELDKALYECVYEARNRPTWLPIPELAVHRLLEAVA
ncbi:phosphotransferase [Amnibacterium kyonggiense]|uniref:Maltokinase n=1 Tax=Amnibacterium kyonggiense TaxID=595671 RepID=A0A4R7FFR7_9MICO|nr:phosphotransferase [Amnibacterium kyonggiense]TDS75710.1 putative trehalose synthase [Amnibacterium kyonggiense]